MFIQNQGDRAMIRYGNILSHGPKPKMLSQNQKQQTTSLERKICIVAKFPDYNLATYIPGLLFTI